MSAILGNGNITFGDGTIQSTKTPTAVSAFTNDSGYMTPTAMAAIYSTRANTLGSLVPMPNCYGSNSGGGGNAFNGYFAMSAYNSAGTSVINFAVNCNCNCNC